MYCQSFSCLPGHRTAEMVTLSTWSSCPWSPASGPAYKLMSDVRSKCPYCALAFFNAYIDTYCDEYKIFNIRLSEGFYMYFLILSTKLMLLKLSHCESAMSKLKNSTAHLMDPGAAVRGILSTLCPSAHIIVVLCMLPFVLFIKYNH